MLFLPIPLSFTSLVLTGVGLATGARGAAELGEEIPPPVRVLEADMTEADLTALAFLAGDVAGSWPAAGRLVDGEGWLPDFEGAAPFFGGVLAFRTAFLPFFRIGGKEGAGGATAAAAT